MLNPGNVTAFLALHNVTPHVLFIKAIHNGGIFADPHAPTVELLQSVNRETATVMLKCVASHYWPKKLTIKWMSGPQSKKDMLLEEKMADGTFRASTNFTIPFSQWPEVESNSCEVVHEATGSRIVRNISREGDVRP